MSLRDGHPGIIGPFPGARECGCEFGAPRIPRQHPPRGDKSTAREWSGDGQMTQQQMEIVRCRDCGLERYKGKRLPTGWKHREDYFCGACWGKRYICRAITMPVASPLDGLTWPEFREVIALMWRQTTAATNWMMTQCYVRDVRRNGQEKIPRMPHLYLYPEARALFPDLPAQTVAAIEQAVQRKYRALRYEINWTGATSLPNHRYPVPFPVHNQSWFPEFEGDAPAVSIRLGNERRRLRLRGGPRYRRQLEGFRQLVKGTAILGELAVYRVRGEPQRDGKNRHDLMIKMAGWFPRRQDNPERTGTLFVLTVKDALFATKISGDQEETPITYNDQIQRWVAKHRRWLQRWSADTRFEHKGTPPFSARREAATVKYRNRLESFCHETAAHLVAFAVRKEFAGIAYDDTEKGYCPEFPWAQLRSMIAQKADAAGIAFSAVPLEIQETQE